MRTRMLFLVILVALVSAAGPASADNVWGQVLGGLVKGYVTAKEYQLSDAEVSQLAEESVSEIEGKYVAYTDPRLTRIGAEAVAQAIAAEPDPKKRARLEGVQFKVMLTDEKNACAVPTRPGRIYITSRYLGLLNDDELRFALAHELGHLANGDAQAALRAEGARQGWFTAALVAANANESWQTGVGVGNFVLRNRYSQDVEKRADNYGLELYHNPQAAVGAFQKLHDGKEPPRWLNALLGSHPLLSDREKVMAVAAVAKGVAASVPISGAGPTTASKPMSSMTGPTAVVVVDPARTEDYGLGFGRGYYYCNDLSEVAKQEAEAALERQGFDVLVSTQDVGPLTDELDLQNSEYGQYGEGRTPKGYFAGAENVFYVSAWVAGANEFQVGDWRRQLEVSGLKVGVLLRQVDLRTRKQLQAGAGVGSVNKISRVRLPLGRNDWNPVEVELNSEQNLARQAVTKAVSGAAQKFAPQAAAATSSATNPVVPVQPVETPTPTTMPASAVPTEPVDEFVSPQETAEPEFGFIGVTDGILQLGSVPITLEMIAPPATTEVTFAVTDAVSKLVLEGESKSPPRFALRIHPEMLSGMKFPLTLSATAFSSGGAKLYRTSVRLERR